jgi:GNAT superfamily N-acetyltransferase
VPEFGIREAVAADVPLIVRFLRSMVQEMASMGGHAASTREEDWKRLAATTREEVEKAEHLYLLADLEGAHRTSIGLAWARVAGLAPVFEPRRVLHIQVLYVLGAYRRRGVGRALLEALLAWGRSEGCVEAELNTLMGNPARALYEELGFSVFQLEMRREL